MLEFHCSWVRDQLLEMEKFVASNQEAIKKIASHAILCHLLRLKMYNLYHFSINCWDIDLKVYLHPLQNQKSVYSWTKQHDYLTFFHQNHKLNAISCGNGNMHVSIGILLLKSYLLIKVYNSILLLFAWFETIIRL